MLLSLFTRVQPWGQPLPVGPLTLEILKPVIPATSGLDALSDEWLWEKTAVWKGWAPQSTCPWDIKKEEGVGIRRPVIHFTLTRLNPISYNTVYSCKFFWSTNHITLKILFNILGTGFSIFLWEWLSQWLCSQGIGLECGLGKSLAVVFHV